MQRSRKTGAATRRTPSRLPLSVAICFAIAGGAQAQQAAPPPAQDAAPTLDAIEVTAQKRTENLQKVPISMQVLGEEQLERLVVSDFEDYVKFLPTVSYQTFGPGFAQIYMRGVASGARLALTALRTLERTGADRALVALCVGVGQGVALALERVR